MSASQSPYGGRWDLSKLHRALQRRSPAEPNLKVGELLISSHGDDQRIFLGLKSSILGFFGGGNNLKICGGTHVSPGHVVLQMKYNQIGFATFGPWIFWSFDFAPILSSLLLEIQSNLSPPPLPPTLGT